MAAPDVRQRQELLAYLNNNGISLADLVLTTLTHPPHNHPYPNLYNDLITKCQPILASLYFNSASRKATLSWGHGIMSKHYADAVSSLAHEEADWHFNATHTKPSQVRDFRLEDLAETAQREQPQLWSLVFRLVTGQRDVDDMSDEEVANRAREAEEEAEAEDEEDEEEIAKGPASEKERIEQYRKKLRDLRVIKTITIICILAQSRFQKCNILQATMGIFLHSCRAPEKLIKVLSRMGLSVSLASIHRAVHSLSHQSCTGIQDVGRSLLVSYAYDNFDVKLNTGIPTVDGLTELLIHLTSGLMLKLRHGVKLDHMRVSGSLWDMNPNNPYASNPKEFNPIQAFELLYHLHPPRPETHIPGRPRGNRHSRFRAWVFMQTLIAYGPSYFAGMSEAVGKPEAVESIPVIKTEQIPLRAMDINQSTVSGNIDAIFNMLAQAGVGDHGAASSGLDEVDIAPFVQLVHGDLGTMERVISAMERRAIDMTPEDRLQFVVFVFGLFHFKMAAADAIWRLLVTPKDARRDPTSFMAFIERLRPKSSNKLINNAKFREQHDLIGHVGSILRLDVWRLEAVKLGYQSLEDWAASQPPVKEVIAMSEHIVQNYVEGGDGVSLYQMRNKPLEHRDKQHENTLRTHAYLLLYEELAYAMNSGDIGRVETLFLPWVQIFKATGKHKYANRTLLFVHQLYNVYPPELRRAIRYNILVNPKGKPGHFRAVDWMVELLNLYTKEIYGGEGSNYTKKRILEESPLVLIYRQSHANFERNFHLPGLSTAHAKKDMTNTFHDLLLYIKSLDESPNRMRKGRTAKYSIPDALSRGSAVLEEEAWRREKRAANAHSDGSREETVEVNSVDDSDQIWQEISSTERRAVGDDGYSRDQAVEITAADLATDDAL